MNEAKVTMNLTRAEAIVLIEFLMRYRDKDRLAVEHDAEQQLLFDLCASIEQQLPELFNPQWLDIVQQARVTVLTESSE